MDRTKSRIEEQLRSLSPEKLKELDSEWDEWDRQIEADARDGKLGKLDALAEKAHRDHAAGRTTPL